MLHRPALHALAFVSLLAAGCGEPSPRATPRPTTAAAPTSQRQLAGVWERTLPHGVTYRLLLFPSGVAAFQHHSATAPISRSYGRWTYAAGHLDLRIVGTEPEQATFPLATRLAVTISASRTLELDANSDRSTWPAADAPFGTGPEATERAAKNESDWAYLVTRSEQPSAPR